MKNSNMLWKWNRTHWNHERLGSTPIQFPIFLLAVNTYADMIWENLEFFNTSKKIYIAKNK